MDPDNHVDPLALIQDCFKIEDDDKAFACLVQTVARPKVPGVCAPQIVLLTQEGCEVCKEEKEAHRDEMSKGLIKEIDLQSQRGQQIAQANGIDWTPALLILDCNDHVIQPRGQDDA